MRACMRYVETAAIKRKDALDFAALSKHGYSGGPSVLYVPPPKESSGDQDWSWSCGKRTEENDASETIEEREITQQRANEGAAEVISSPSHSLHHRYILNALAMPCLKLQPQQHHFEVWVHSHAI